MVFSNISYPRFVYVQTTEPDDKTAGRLWYNTSSNLWYSSDGAAYSVVVNPNDQLNALINENSVNILELQAQSTLSATQSAYMLRDIYTDTTGYLNTIDTGNTNATFTGATETANAHALFSDTSSATSKRGVKIVCRQAGVITKAVKSAGSGCTKAYIYGADDVTLKAVVTFSGNDAVLNYQVHKDEIISIQCDAAGGSYTSDRSGVGALTPPLECTNLAYVSGSGSAYLENVESIYFSPLVSNYANGGAAKVVQTTAATIASGASKFQIYTLGGAVTGTGSIDYDISFDNGAHYQTGIDADTETTITTTGTQLILKQNLNKGSGAGTAAANGYAVMFW